MSQIDPKEPYPLPRDAVEAALRKWMASEQLNEAERDAVDYARRVNALDLFERGLITVDAAQTNSAWEDPLHRRSA